MDEELRKQLEAARETTARQAKETQRLWEDTRRILGITIHQRHAVLRRTRYEIERIKAKSR